MRTLNNNFTIKEQEFLLNYGYKVEELPQIAFTKDHIIIKNDKGRVLSPNYVRSVLGVERYISAIARSSFHKSATRCYGHMEIKINVIIIMAIRLRK